MGKKHNKLDQALKDLIESYVELEEELSAKHRDDEDALNAGIIEVLETSIEGALEEHDYSSSKFANLLSVLTESLEQIDPAAFEGEEDEDYNMSEVDYDEDESDIDDADLDEDMDEDEDGDDDDDDDDD